MASYTDKAPTFNPYIQQQPVDAMVKVGVHKQQQYDQNLQRIQSTMDKISGMGVGRDVDKQYLESKMNEVTSKLQTFASGDFSNSNLTRSVTGMVSQVGNDEVIQNAVMAAQKAKQARSLQLEYTKKGKGSASNDWLLGTAMDKWQNDPNPGADFNGTYKPYADYNKKSLEIIKNVLKDENISDSDYYIDSKGKVVFTDEMVRTKVAGRSKQKIQTALMAGLAPDDWEQLQVDGRYQYSNIQGEDFKNEISSSYNNNITSLNTEKDRLNSLMKTAASPVVQGELQQQLADLENTIGKEADEFNVLNDYFEKGQFEGAKAKLYTMNWMNNTGNAFSNQENSKTLHTSPRAEFKFKRENEARRRTEYNLGYDQKERFHADDLYYKDETLKEARKANKISMEGLGGYGPVLNPKDQSELLKLSPEILGEEIKLSEEIIYKEKLSIGKYYTNEEDYNKNADKNKYPTYEDYAITFIDSQEKIYKNNPASLKSKVRDFFDKKTKADRVLETKKQVKLDAELLGESEYSITGILEDEDRNKQHSFQFEDGQVLEVSTEEILSFNAKWKDIKSKINFMPGTGTAVYTTNQAFSTPLSKIVDELGLSSAEKKLLEITTKEKSDLAGLANLLSPGEQEVSNVIFGYRRKYNDKTEALLKEKNKVQREYISDRLMAMQGQTHSIDLSTKQQAGGTNLDQFKNVLEGFARNATQQEGIALSPGVTAESISKVIPNLENASITIVEDVGTGDDRTTVREITARNIKGDIVKFKINEDQYNTTFRGRFDRTPGLQVFQEYKSRILATKSGGATGPIIGTTAKDGKSTNKNNAYLGNVDFPGVNLFGISGNLVSEDGVYYDLELNIKNPITGKWIENIEYNINPQVDIDLLKQMQSLSDYQIFEMLTGQQPTQEQLQILQEKAKQI